MPQRLHRDQPDGKVFYNTVEFDAVPAQGGTLCTNGKWRARDGSMSGNDTLPRVLQGRRGAWFAGAAGAAR